ncbi:MAG: hypothetical protein JSS32_06355 [Verrucomicrobia bacterium]|nr:hypothetical protein [Verrucomicrobiota bacterium]
MKKIFLFLLFAISGYAENLVIENQTDHPAKGSKMAIQWADSAREVDQENMTFLSGGELQNVQKIKQAGKVDVKIPGKAAYFRVLVWSKGTSKPDLHTNWVEVVPKKVYLLKKDHLVPSELMSGTGC